MKTHLYALPLFILALALALPGGSAVAAGGVGKMCETDEYPVFYGESGGVVAAICLPDDPDSMGNYLTFYFKRPDGTVLDLHGQIDSDKRFVVARNIGLSGGGYSYVRINQGSKSYIAYSGIGRFHEGDNEPVGVAGLAVEENGKLIEYYDMSDDYTSELGPELFEVLEMALDAYEFALPLSDANDEMRILGDALADRVSAIKAKGFRALIRSEGAGTLSDKPCRFYSLGEEKGSKYSALDHYAVDRGGRIYILDPGADGKYRPLETAGKKGAEEAAPKWLGEYCNERGCLSITNYRKGAAGGYYFGFSFIIEGKMVGEGTAAVDGRLGSSFELDFSLESGDGSVRVTHGGELEVSPEEEWSKQCPGVYKRK